jgi:hypothetical protein
LAAHNSGFAQPVHLLFKKSLSCLRESVTFDSTELWNYGCAMPQTVTSTTILALLVFAFSSQAHTPLNKTQDLCFAVFGFA